MKRLVEALAAIIKEKAQDAAQAQAGGRLESRLIFQGPPLEILSQVFDELTVDGGISVLGGAGKDNVILPVLLQLSHSAMNGPNPGIGQSGKCDESHLLHIRNSPDNASFVALMQPGQQSNRSVASTTDEFGVSASNNSSHATFEAWWEDGFIQQLVTEGIRRAGLTDEALEDARFLIGHASAALDDVAPGKGPWQLLSRLYSIPDSSTGLSPGSALALACGFPPMQDGGVSSRSQVNVLDRVAGEMADGFRMAIERLVAVATSEPTKGALADFLRHLQEGCEVPTAFERAASAFYLPSDELELELPPPWWLALTTESWSDLLAEEPDVQVGELSISCTNPILPPAAGMPSIVRGEAELAVAVEGAEDERPVEVFLTGGPLGKAGTKIQVGATTKYVAPLPANELRSPMAFKIEAVGRKPATTKVVSLARWLPGLIVTSRLASKLSLPKKPRKGSTKANWETGFSLPGPGRYELLLYFSPGVEVLQATGIPDDATEQAQDSAQDLQLHLFKEDFYQIEIEADSNYQLDIAYKVPIRGTETCRVYVTCEEATEEGCRSEFERLIKVNRRHLEKFDAKAVVQLDRHARSSSLQSWVLDEQNVSTSFIPLILSDDYSARWASPDWSAASGPILSEGRFLHDPRPPAAQFSPPTGFVDARREIASRVRQTSDQAGLLESAPLGKWISNDHEFRSLVESYLEAYTAWLVADRDVACWVDVVAVCPLEPDGRTLSQKPDAIILSPLHPVRLAWHCLAQQVLFEAAEGPSPMPCPAASILDPDCIPDLLIMSLQAPGGPAGVDRVPFLSVECNSDYWSVLWNGSRLSQIADKSRKPPFDSAFGLIVGGISSGFSPAQVARALEDVSDLLAAKPIISLVVSSGGGATDACSEGLATWCQRRFGSSDSAPQKQGVGPRILEVYDTRPASSRPDQAMVANLSEDTGNRVRWFDKQPAETRPDLGISAQLDSAQPESTTTEIRSPLAAGGLIRHRVRRPLHSAFLAESRRALPAPPSGEVCVNLAQ